MIRFLKSTGLTLQEIILTILSKTPRNHTIFHTIKWQVFHEHVVNTAPCLLFFSPEAITASADVNWDPITQTTSSPDDEFVPLSLCEDDNLQFVTDNTLEKLNAPAANLGSKINTKDANVTSCINVMDNASTGTFHPREEDDGDSVAATARSTGSNQSNTSTADDPSAQSMITEDQSAAAATSECAAGLPHSNRNMDNASNDESCAATNTPNEDIAKWEEFSVNAIKDQKGGEFSGGSDESIHSQSNEPTSWKLAPCKNTSCQNSVTQSTKTTQK